MKKFYLILIGVVVIAVLGLLSKTYAPNLSKNEAQDIEEVKTLVANFGKELKFVSLLAPKADVEKAMDEHYAKYVTPELLAQWKQNPSLAPGRQVSSPWPDRIEIQSTEMETETSYKVNAKVIEITSNEADGGMSSSYTVMLKVQKIGSVWRVSSFQKSIYNGVPKNVTINGTLTCLPHKDMSGPITLECAFGLKEDDTASYYALDTSMLETDQAVFSETGTHVSVFGLLVPIEQISSNQWQKYNIKGIIRVASFTKQ